MTSMNYWMHDDSLFSHKLLMTYYVDGALVLPKILDCLFLIILGRVFSNGF